jgi:proliferating cell nuclear antigen
MYKVTTMSGTFKTFLKFLSELENEAKVELTAEGIHARVVDPANAALIDVTLDKAAFLEYNVEPTVIGLDLGKINRVISSAGKLSEITLEEVDGKTNISFDGMEFEVKLLAPDTMKATCRIPTIPFTVVCSIDSVFIVSIINGAKSVISDDIKTTGGNVVIATENDMMTFIAESNEGDKFKFPVNVGGNNRATTAMYAFPYFKVIGMFEGEIELSYGKDIPSFWKSRNEEMTVIYMIAPRIGEN